MSKAVLISIRPKWCEKIASGKKTIEVRKTRPELKTPFKVYIYCTSGHPYISVKDGAMDYLYARTNTVGRCNGKVMGEFTCDRIYELETRSLGGSYYVKGENQPTTNAVARQSCLTLRDMREYLQAAKGYGWHISDLKIYDAPRELSEFVALRMCMVKNGLEVRPIDRPPQNWCYVEERDGSMEEMRYGDMQCCRCVHCSGMDVNSIGEQINYCELKAEWMNVTLGDCLGNCESEEGKPWNV